MICMELVTKNEEKKDHFIIYHQNIRSLYKNKEELSASFLRNLSPHIICLSKHHMKEREIINF